MKPLYTYFAVTALAAGAVATTTAIVAPEAQTTVRAAASSTVLESDEQQHMMETLENGTIALEASKIARIKATDRYVKAFADSEVAEQTTVAEVLTSMAPTIKAPTSLTAEGKNVVDRLNAAKPGPAFDAMYVDAQLTGHRELLKAQEDYLNGGDVLAQVNVAKLLKGHVSDHIKALEALTVALKK